MEPLLGAATHAPHLIPTWLEPWIGRAYVLAGCFFILGSALFFPEFKEYYLEGCCFYFAGGGIYLCTSAYDLLEVWHTSGGEFDRAMNLLYVVGSVVYLVGTLLYLPGMPRLGGRLPTELGAWCFIVGSLFFIYACFVNGAHTGDVFADASAQLVREDRRAAASLRQMKVNVLLATSCTMLGSACFLVGSVLYLPTIGCGELTLRCGTWLFVVGSGLFVCAGVLPIVKKQLRAADDVPPPFETVVHGTVRLKRARPTFQSLGMAMHAANRFTSPCKTPLPLNLPDNLDAESPQS